MRPHLSLSLTMLALLIAIPTRAQQTTAAWSQPRFLSDAKAFYTAASSAPVQQGADVVVLSEETSYVFDSDGKAVMSHYLAYKIITQKGASQWASTELDWEPWRETKPALKVRVITPDFVVHELDPKTITDSAAKDSDEDIYGDGRVERAPFPAIAPGSVVEEEETNSQSPSFAGGGFTTRIYPGRGVPVVHASVALDAPLSLPLRFTARPLDFAKPERSESNGRVHIVFAVGPLDPLEDAEPNLPSDVQVYPEIVFSTASSWKDVATAYDKIVNEKSSSPEVKPLVARLTAGNSTREKKLNAIIRYLAKEVRYTGIEFGDAAVVPHSPAETLKRKYGDCKDKSTLLVALLRAAEIPAYVALLSAGRREDVIKELPGMGIFDHAIVYVPGSPDSWIDATDEYAKLGQLPAGDQGRLALIARPETDSLTLTAVSSSKDNVELEERRFVLSENGPAHVIETNFPQGTIESEFRSYYANQQEKDFKKGLTDYVKGQYLADKLDRAIYSDPGDLTKPFELVVESSKAKRGFTELDGAVVAVRINGIFHRLPNDLLEKEEDEKSVDAAKDKPKKPRAADYQLSEPFVTEWRYSIQPPLGFRAKPLPANAEIHIGPALLTEQFSSAPDGAVSAVVRFDTVQRRFTAQETKELRRKVVELRDSQAIMIYFEPLALALLNDGKPREAFQSYRDLIAQHPKEAVHHLQKALALLEAGLGGAARTEALGAAKLEPTSALAQKTLAQVLESDLVGRKMARGADFAGAAAAFRAAKKLDPDDHEIPGDLAILLEYNSDGERYGAGSRLKESIAEYRLLTPEQLADIGLKGNLPYTLFYAAEFQEARKAAEDLNPQTDQVIIAAEAAMHGGKAGIAEAKRRASADARQKELLRNSAQMLLRARIYPSAADLFEAGAAGENASSTLSLASLLRKLQKHEEVSFKADARSAALNYFLTLCRPRPDSVQFTALHTARSREILQRMSADDLSADMRRLRNRLACRDVSNDVSLDILLQTVELEIDGDDAAGYRVLMHVSGTTTLIVFLAREQDEYKIVGNSDTPNTSGRQILDLLNTGNATAARTWLDWVRDDWHLAGGDDPLAGFAFPRFWTKGKSGDLDEMKLAAASLLVYRKETAPEGIAALESAKSAAGDARVNISIALMDGYWQANEFAKLAKLAAELNQEFPESRRLFFNYQWALRNLKQFAEADALANDRLKRIPKDIDALRSFVSNAVAKEDYSLAVERAQKIVDLGKAEPSDLNSLAWNRLFTGKAGQADVDAVSKALRANQNDASVLHTLGCIYAEIGKTKEAHDVLIQAMNALKLDEPDLNYWYAFGRIAEAYGENVAARENYQKAEKPKNEMQIPGSSYRLAQMRLGVLGESRAVEKR